ncbi:3-deoxy-7-phosphoheptulonate synthase [Candidatus Marinamargulisbacteria bacterium SCGC AG-439-L15]|nr:3-deoxy-7-phosphoheptulonate synthase [Candidatus Marinamargulisbacteria bacterium SCGC AG-439-L15]
MIIIMKTGAKTAEITAVKDKIESLGYDSHIIEGVVRTVVAAVGDKDKEPLKSLQYMDGVESVMPVRQPYKLASRSTKEEDTVIDVDGVKVGGGSFSIFAGPCSVETDEQIMASADMVKKTGCQFLRGGAYKPRTSPYSFQGLEEEGLKLLKAAKDRTGLRLITELVEPKNTALVAEYVDIIQIGARNMQNFPLLKEVGKVKTPVFLKRGLSATLEDLLMSAEYILSEGNPNVMLCERGIRTYENAYRNTLDLNAVPALKSMTHLPVIVDPSHGTGRRDLTAPMAKAAIAAGADGIMIETHPNPDEAWSDGPQSLPFDQFEQLITDIKPFLELVGKTV